MGYAAYFHGQALLSWVPHQLISKVQSGIDANPEGCIKRAEMVSERYGDQRQQKRMLFRSESQSSLMVTAAKKVTATVTNAAPMMPNQGVAPVTVCGVMPSTQVKVENVKRIEVVAGLPLLGAPQYLYNHKKNCYQ